MKERGAKVLKEKKKQKKKGQDDKKDKPKGLYTRESEAQLMLQAMAFNEKVIATLSKQPCTFEFGLKPKPSKHLFSTSNFTITLLNCFVLEHSDLKTKQLRSVLVKLLIMN